MGIEIVIKVATVGLMIAVINQVLVKCGREEYAMIVSLVGLAAIILMLAPYITDLYTLLNDLIEM